MLHRVRYMRAIKAPRATASALCLPQAARAVTCVAVPGYPSCVRASHRQHGILVPSHIVATLQHLHCTPHSTGSLQLRGVHFASGADCTGQASRRDQGKAEAGSAKAGAASDGEEAEDEYKQIETTANEHLWTIPNMLTVSRIVLSPVLAWWVVSGNYEPAVFGFAFAGACDWLDGYIARKYNMTSVLGSYLDPVADKILVGSLATALAVKGLLYLPVVGVVLFRDVGLIAGSFWYRYKTRPEGKAFFDLKGSATFEITPSIASKFNTAAQLAWITGALTQAAWGIPNATVNAGLTAMVAVTTVWSGYGYWQAAGIGQIKMPEGVRSRIAAHRKRRADKKEAREQRKRDAEEASRAGK